VAVTFDDLPAMEPYDLKTTRDINGKILAVIAANKIPVVGFVTESRILVNNEGSERLSILRQWLDNGLELGNHTFAHKDFHSTSLAAFEQDVIRGETQVKKLLEERGLKLRYFRHPYLHTGTSPLVKEASQRFLVERGYTVAPVTHDNEEWIFSRVYDRAWKLGNRESLQRIGSTYIEYMRVLFQYYEDLSRQLFGYEIRQVLLLHDNRLNADFLGNLVRMMNDRGYKFVSLEHAFQDKAYESPDAYTGPKGLSWLQRWALTRELNYPKEPDVPASILREFEQSLGQPTERPGGSWSSWPRLSRPRYDDWTAIRQVP
jgi:peptidoglycan/xylan/chitin deacetylase (PgdA/CDA1 family)